MNTEYYIHEVVHNGNDMKLIETKKINLHSDLHFSTNADFGKVVSINISRNDNILHMTIHYRKES